MKKLLVVGANTGGIADSFVQHFRAENPITSQKSKVEGITAILMPEISELDVTDSESLRSYVRENGPFNGIVYSAGISRLQWISEVTNPEWYDKTQSVNTRGMVLLAAHHVKEFPASPVRFVAVVSDAAHTAMRGSISYCVSKAAQEMAVKVLAREMSPAWVVVGVSPGVVDDTGMTNQLEKDIPKFRGWTDEKARDYEASSSVIGRRIMKSEVAEAMLFALEGPRALNGSIITVNGGK